MHWVISCEGNASLHIPHTNGSARGMTGDPRAPVLVIAAGLLLAVAFPVRADFTGQVIGVADGKWGQVPLAVVQLRRHGSPDLRAFLEPRLARCGPDLAPPPGPETFLAAALRPGAGNPRKVYPL